MDLAELGVVTALHDQSLSDWYNEDGPRPGGSTPDSVEPGTDVESVVRAQHYCNFSLWNLEDQARRTDVDDGYIAEIKRAIDGWNQRRNDLVEQIDLRVLAESADADTASAEQHSETAGMIVDRLSILSLKIWHMRLNIERARSNGDEELAAECEQKLERLIEQRSDLAACLAKLMSDFRAGRRFYKLYRQFKAYNDPRLNPALAKSEE